MIREGHDVCVVVPGNLLPQCIAQYEKFKTELKLADLMIETHTQIKNNWRADTPISLSWLSRYQHGKKNGRCPIFLIEQELLRPNPSRYTQYFQDELASIPWRAMMFDEATRVPVLLEESLPRTFGVSFNASSAGTISNYASDSELGKLPVLDVDCYVVEKIEKTCSPVHIPLHLGTANTWIHRCIGTKTLVVTNDRFGAVDKTVPGYNKPSQTVNDRKEESLGAARLPDLTHVFGECKGKSDKGNMVTNFCQAKEGLMLAPMKYLSRGFNIPVDSLIILDFNGTVRPKQLLQVVMSFPSQFQDDWTCSAGSNRSPSSSHLSGE